MNYKIEIDLDKIPGAVVKCREIDGKTQSAVIIPVDNDKGTVVDGYWAFDYKVSGQVWLPLRNGPRLTLMAYESRDARYGSHSLKPSFSSEYNNSMSEEERKAVPYCGKMKERQAQAGQSKPAQAQESKQGKRDDGWW